MQDNEAAFVILRRYPDGVPDGVPDGSDGAPNGNASVSAPDKFICITYVPDTAPVRSKMLFASTRLTLVRELGSEKFAETRFVTSKGELGEEGWWRGKGRDDGSEDAGVPLTEGERTLKGVREAEAEEGSMGTRGRGAGFGGGGGGGVSFPVEGDALGALRGLGGSGSGSGGDNLVQLVCIACFHFQSFPVPEIIVFVKKGGGFHLLTFHLPNRKSTSPKNPSNSPARAPRTQKDSHPPSPTPNLDIPSSATRTSTKVKNHHPSSSSIPVHRLPR